jgi:hypothetical protein
MNETPVPRANQAALLLILLSCIFQYYHHIFSARRHRRAETEALQERLNSLRHSLQQSRTNLQQSWNNIYQDRRVTEELMRFLRSRSDDRLTEIENATLAPTTTEINEFLRQVTRLKEDIQDCAERISTSLHIQDPPPRYSPVRSSGVQCRQLSTPSGYCASQIPLPTQRASEIRVLSSGPTLHDENNSALSTRCEVNRAHGDVGGLAPLLTPHSPQHTIFQPHS